jgi:hypothetical protein
MSTIIEAFNYQIGIDASGLEAGARLTRSELGQLRRTFNELTEPAEKSARQIALLTKALNAKNIDANQYVELTKRLRELGEQTKQSTEISQHANSVRAQLSAARQAEMSDLEKYRQQMELTKAAIKEGDLTLAESAEYLRRYKAELPEAIALEKQRLAAQKEAKQLIASLQTEQEKYDNQLARHKQLVEMEMISQEQANQLAQREAAKLPENIALVQKRNELQAQGNQLIASLQTDQEKYDNQLAMHNVLVAEGIISQQQANQLAQLAAANLPENIAALQRQNDLQREAFQLISSLQTEQQQYDNQLARHREIVEAGFMSEQQANQLAEQAAAKLPANIAETQRLNQLQQEAARIKQSQISPAEQLAARENQLAEAVRRGYLTQLQADRELQSARDDLSGLTAEKQRADQITQKYITAEERLGAELRDVQQAYDKNLISLETYNRAKRDVGSQRTIARVQDFASAAGLGGLSSGAASLAAMGLATGGALIGVQLLTAGLTAAKQAAEALVGEMVRVAGEIDKTNQRARSLGASVEGLSAFQYAAQTIAQIGPDQATKAYEKLTIRIREAASGAGEAAGILKQLQLDPTQLARMDTFDQVKVIADKLQGLGDAARATQASIKLFEEEGSQLSLVLMGGSSAMAEAERQARALGLVMSASEALGVEQAVKAAGDFAKIWQGLIVRLTVEAAPVFQVIAGDVRAMVQEFTKGAAAGMEFAKPLTIGIGLLADGVYYSGQLARVLYNISTMDYLEAFDVSKQMLEHESTAIRWSDALDNVRMSTEFAADAQKRRNAETRELNALQQGELAAANQLKAVRQSLLELGANSVDVELKRFSAAGANIKQQMEFVQLQQDLANREQENQLAESLAADRKTLAITQATRAWLQYSEASGIVLDETNARAMAELQWLGLKGTQLREHLLVKSQIAAIDVQGKREQEAEKVAQAQQQKLEQKAKSEIDALRKKAEEIRKASISPLQSLTEEFSQLGRMYQMGLLHVNDYQSAMLRAARETQAQMPKSELGKPIESASFGSVAAYKNTLRINEQNRESKQEQATALQLVALAKSRADELARGTGELARQAELLALMQRGESTAPAPNLAARRSPLAAPNDLTVVQPRMPRIPGIPDQRVGVGYSLPAAPEPPTVRSPRVDYQLNAGRPPLLPGFPNQQVGVGYQRPDQRPEIPRIDPVTIQLRWGSVPTAPQITAPTVDLAATGRAPQRSESTDADLVLRRHLERQRQDARDQIAVAKSMDGRLREHGLILERMATAIARLEPTSTLG